MCIIYTLPRGEVGMNAEFIRFLLKPEERNMNFFLFRVIITAEQIYMYYKAFISPCLECFSYSSCPLSTIYFPLSTL